MENKTKPRICEVLGVEVGEQFRALTPHMIYEHLEIDPDGVVWDMGESRPYKVGPWSLCYMINHPECIRRIPRWTPEEVELAKAIKVVWPNADGLIRICDLHKEWIRIVGKDGYSLGVKIGVSRFPALKLDETVLLSDIIGGEGNG